MGLIELYSLLPRSSHEIVQAIVAEWLRRLTQVPVEQSAWVRIPSIATFYLFNEQIFSTNPKQPNPNQISPSIFASPTRIHHHTNPLSPNILRMDILRIQGLFSRGSVGSSLLFGPFLGHNLNFFMAKILGFLGNFFLVREEGGLGL